MLVLGGGDGLAAREILKYDDVEEITVIDLDPMITELASTDSTLRRLNQDSLHNPKVKVINQDAQQFLQATDQRYNLIIIDLPDPTDASLGSLYSDTFYHLVKRHLGKDGLAVTQSSSPFLHKMRSGASIKTIEAAGLYATAYHVNVPSFGEWGFNLFGGWQIDPEKVRITVPTRFLSDESLAPLFVFDKDIDEVETQINTLLTPILLFYHREDWESWGL